MKIKLERVRLSFPKLFEPRAHNGGKPKFSASFLLPKGTEHGERARQQMLAAIEAVKAEMWKSDAPRFAQDKLPLRDGDTASWDGYPGNWYVTSSNIARPVIVDRDGVTPLTQDSGRPYAGCWVNVLLNVWAQNNSFGKRINASVDAVQFVADGQSFSGGAVPAGAFAAVSEDDLQDLL